MHSLLLADLILQFDHEHFWKYGSFHGVPLRVLRECDRLVLPSFFGFCVHVQNAVSWSAVELSKD